MFGNRIRSLRKKANLSQRQLGEKLQLSESTIAHYESNRRSPDPFTLKNIANFFGVSIDYLMGNDTTSNTIQNISDNDEELNEKLKRLAEDEFDRTLFKKYGDLTDEKKKIVMSVINGIIEEADKED